MATEMITLKLDEKFLSEIDTLIEKSNYQNRTEFIREALREKVDMVKLNAARLELANLKGASKRKISNEEYEKAREDAFNELDKTLR